MASSDESVPISERVKFWEEQDKINQELIPRVIRQHELLTGHIAEHENLPAVVADAVQQAIVGAREEQRQLYESALETARAEFSEQLDNQKQSYEAALNAAKTEFAERASGQQRQYETSLEAAETELNRQMQETLDSQTRRMRNLFISVAAVFSVIIVVIATLVSLIVG